MDKITWNWLHSCVAALGYSSDQSSQIMNMLNQPAGLILFASEERFDYLTGVNQTITLLKRMHQEAFPGNSPRNVESDYLREHNAKAAIELARAGHLVIAGLEASGSGHPYSVFGTLVDSLRVPKEWLADPELPILIVNQRYVPVLCPSCKVPASWRTRLRSVLPVRRGRQAGCYVRSEHGCVVCGHHGTVGQTLCAEVLAKSADMEQAILAGLGHCWIWDFWRKDLDRSNRDCMRGRTIDEHATWKVRQGIIARRDAEDACLQVCAR